MNDLRSIRPTPADVDAELTPQRRAAIINEVIAPRSAPALRKTRWLAAVGVAAALIIAATFTVQLLLKPPVAPPAEETPASSPFTVSAPPTQKNPTQPLTVSLINYGSGTVVSPDVLQQVAATAENTDPPTGLAEGKFLHVVEVSQQDGKDTINDAYIDADGWTWRHDTMELVDGGPKYENWQLFSGDIRADEFNSLPTTPQELEAELRSRTGNNSEDERVFKAIDEILIAETATPELRAASIKVLQHVAENPQEPAPDDEGVLATPKLEVTELTLPEGDFGYRVTFSDPGSRPGSTHSVLLNATGQILETVYYYDGSGPESSEVTSYSSQVQVREYVDELPEEFVVRLGTEHVVQDQ